MIKTKHSHPANILLLLPRFLLLLLIPLLRSLVIVFTGGLRAWVQSAWVDVLLVLLILSFVLLRWYSVTYSYSEKGITYASGVFYRSKIIIPAENICTVGQTAHFFLKPFRVVELRADTSAGRSKKLDFSLLVQKQEALQIFGKRAALECPLHDYRADDVSVLLLSLLTSNSFAGILLIITFISQLGEIIGRELSRYFVDSLNNLGAALAFGIPPAAAVVGYLLLFSWFLAFVSEFIGNKNFTLTRSRDELTIARGVFTNRGFATKITGISLVDIRQTVFSRLFGYCAVFVHAVGFSPKHGDDAVIIPATKLRAAEELIGRMLPEFPVTKRVLKPNYGALFRFIMDPLYLCLGIPVGAFILSKILPEWSVFGGFVALMGMLPALWFLAVRLTDYFTAGLSRAEDIFTLRYSSGFYLHTAVFHKNKIVSVCTRQSVFQVMDHRCDVFVYTFSQGVTMHRCRNLHREEVLEFFGTDFILKQN